MDAEVCDRAKSDQMTTAEANLVSLQTDGEEKSDYCRTQIYFLNLAPSVLL